MTLSTAPSGLAISTLFNNWLFTTALRYSACRNWATHFSEKLGDSALLDRLSSTCQKLGCPLLLYPWRFAIALHSGACQIVGCPPLISLEINECRLLEKRCEENTGEAVKIGPRLLTSQNKDQLERDTWQSRGIAFLVICHSVRLMLYLLSYWRNI